MLANFAPPLRRFTTQPQNFVNHITSLRFRRLCSFRFALFL